MHLNAKPLLIAVLLVSGGLCAQEAYRSPDPDLLARLSFDGPATAQGEGSRHVCVAVSRDGDYRIVQSLNGGHTQRLHGKMPQQQFQQLKTLLGSTDFRVLSGNHGGLIRQESETFGAEVIIPGRRGEDRTQQLHWLNADGESPFPAAVTKVVNWLRRFEPTNGKEFEYAEYPDVCPSGGLRFLQPSVATNLHP